jgi:sensor histidine kinase regulating citrate/malate metabolism
MLLYYFFFFFLAEVSELIILLEVVSIILLEVVSIIFEEVSDKALAAFSESAVAAALAESDSLEDDVDDSPQEAIIAEAARIANNFFIVLVLGLKISVQY